LDASIRDYRLMRSVFGRGPQPTGVERRSQRRSRSSALGKLITGCTGNTGSKLFAGRLGLPLKTSHAGSLSYEIPLLTRGPHSSDNGSAILKVLGPQTRSSHDLLRGGGAHRVDGKLPSMWQDEVADGQATRADLRFERCTGLPCPLSQFASPHAGVTPLGRVATDLIH
jgi:hypothetical protein